MPFGVKIHVWGPYACFTRPEMKVERVSYDVMTPSAARGILEAIYWKPEIRWVIDRIHVLNPIRFINIRRNEVSEKASEALAKSAMKNGKGKLGLYVEDIRQQRAALVLKDVAYIIEAHFNIINGEDNAGKHLDIFNRRVAKGQTYHRPYLGCREFAAYFEAVSDQVRTSALTGTKDLGFMLHDIDFSDPSSIQPRFFRAELREGVLDVPEWNLIKV